MQANARGGSFQTMPLGFGLGGCIYQKRYVIGVVGVSNCFCGVLSASFLCQLESVLFDFINRCSKHVVETDDKEDLFIIIYAYKHIYISYTKAFT